MKYLSNYIEEAQTKAFDEAGAFFAFSNKQFNEGMKEGIVYCNMGSGLLCPKDNAEKLDNDLMRIAAEGIKADLAENGRRGVIHRELGNHEYCITHDITDVVEKLSGYPITEKEIRAEVPEYLKAFHEWEDAQAKEATI